MFDESTSDGTNLLTGRKCHVAECVAPCLSAALLFRTPVKGSIFRTALETSPMMIACTVVRHTPTTKSKEMREISWWTVFASVHRSDTIGTTIKKNPVTTTVRGMKYLT